MVVLRVLHTPYWVGYRSIPHHIKRYNPCLSLPCPAGYSSNFALLSFLYKHLLCCYKLQSIACLYTAYIATCIPIFLPLNTHSVFFQTATWRISGLGFWVLGFRVMLKWSRQAGSCWLWWHEARSLYLFTCQAPKLSTFRFKVEPFKFPSGFTSPSSRRVWSPQVGWRSPAGLGVPTWGIPTWVGKFKIDAQ